MVFQVNGNASFKLTWSEWPYNVADFVFSCGMCFFGYLSRLFLLNYYQFQELSVEGIRNTRYRLTKSIFFLVYYMNSVIIFGYIGVMFKVSLY